MTKGTWRGNTVPRNPAVNRESAIQVAGEAAVSCLVAQQSGGQIVLLLGISQQQRCSLATPRAHAVVGANTATTTATRSTAAVTRRMTNFFAEFGAMVKRARWSVVLVEAGAGTDACSAARGSSTRVNRRW